MTTREFFILSECTKDDLQAKISRLQRPLCVDGRKVPESLNKLKIGDILTMQAITSDMDAILVPCNVILKMTEAEVMEADASEVFGFVVWVAKEMERINKLFERTRIPPTTEEKAAGAEEMNFGAFGILDWYARRMGITSHEEAANVSWMTVYKCLDMDAKQTMYERRLRNEYSKKSHDGRR